MVSRSLFNVLIIVTLLASSLVALSPPMIAHASGVRVSDDSGNDYWPSLAESPSGDRLVAAWNQELKIKVAVSTNGGSSWSSSIEIDSFSGTDVDLARVAFDSNSNLHLVYRAGTGGGRRIYYWYVLAGNDPAVRGNWRSASTVCSNCIEPSLTADRAGSVYLAYDDRDSGVIRIRRFSGPGSVDGTQQTISGGGQPAIAAAIDGRIHVAFLSSGNSIRYQRYTSWGTFNREADITVSTDYANNDPAIAADNNGHVHIAWVQSEDNGDRTNRIVYYSEVINNGSPSGKVPVSSTRNADVHQQVSVAATGTSNVYVSWTGFEEDVAANGGSVFMNRRLGGTWEDRLNLDARRISDSGVRANRSKFGLSSRNSVFLVYGEGDPLITKIFSAVPPDSLAPSITNVTGVPFSTAAQRITVTVSANDGGTNPSGVASIEYSFDNVNFATGATFGAAANVTVNVDIDLANPGAGGSWNSGGRTIFLRARDAANNAGAVAQVLTNFTPGPVTAKYLAEGYTGGTFDEFLTLANPTGNITYVSIRFQYAGGSSGPGGTVVRLEPNQRRTILIDSVAGTGKALSLKLESDQNFFAERPMYFQNYPSASGAAYGRAGASALAGINGGHLGVAANAPALNWYFAEGFTGGEFEAFFTIQNPNVEAASVSVTYFLTGGGPPLSKPITVAGQSRHTVFVHDPNDPGGIGPNQAFSARVSADRAIIVERVQYFRYYNPGRGLNGLTGGTATLGATAPAQAWHFAEGFTGGGFDEFLTIQNPTGNPGTATVTYYIENVATPETRSVPLLANSRTTIRVHDVADASNPGGLGPNLAHATSITADVPIVVERPMYFLYNGGTAATNNIDGGHNAMGSTTRILPSSAVVMAEGYTGDGFHEYLTFQNPNPFEVPVTITYLLANGTAVPKPAITLPANQRLTVAVHNAGDPTGGGLGLNQEFGVQITNNSGSGSILAERVMYFRYGSAATGGSAAFGSNLLGSASGRP